MTAKELMVSASNMYDILFAVELFFSA